MKVWEVIYHGWHDCESSDCCWGWGSDDSSEGLFSSEAGALAFVKDRGGSVGREGGQYDIKERTVQDLPVTEAS